MALNTIEFAKLYQKKLDEAMIDGAVTGFMENNAGQVQYSGGDTVLMPVIGTAGLANYDREAGYTKGGVTLRYDSYKMTMDRARQFLLDRNTVDESNFITTAASVMANFQKYQVIPEVDAYRISKLATLAINASQKTELALTQANIVSALDADLQTIQDICGDIPVLIMMSRKVKGILAAADNISKHLDAGNFSSGKINRTVKTYDENPILYVPSARMKTAFTFNDGTTTGQTAGGFVAGSTAQDINWIIAPQTVPIAVSKTDNIKVFTPDQVQDHDAWKIDYRKYHDLWVPAQKLTSIMVNVAPKA